MAKKIAILSFNVFAAGGTTKSNLNLIRDFAAHDYQIDVYNYRPFTKMDILTLEFNEEYVKKAHFHRFEELADGINSDYIFVTREAFFAFAPFLRKKSPKAILIGEIHAAFDLIDKDLIKPYLNYFHLIRVSTPSVKERFRKTFHFDRTYVQTISLSHLKGETNPSFHKSKQDSGGNYNFLVRSRFADPKDISYGIRLMDYLVNYLGHKNFKFYINGYGQGKTLYRNLINNYGLNNEVLINEGTPDNYIYLSTSRVESFGYSIAEEFDLGHPQVIYPGDDNVVYENFADFRNCLWIKKQMADDAQAVLAYVKEPNTLEDYRWNLAQLNALSDDYVQIFEEKLKQLQPFSAQLDEEVTPFEETFKKVQTTNLADELSKYRRIYNRVKAWPLIGALIQQPKIRQFGINLLSKHVHQQKKQQPAEITASANKYFIESFHGHNFSGDPKYFALAIKKRHPQAEVYVSSVNQLVDMEVRRYGFLPLRTGSRQYIYKFKQCKYIFVNGNTLDKAGKSLDQVVVQTWHGFPMKKMVNDLEDRQQRKVEATAFAPRMLKWNYLTTSSSYNTKLLHSAFDLKSNRQLKIIENGTPKNEYLLRHRHDADERKRVFEKYFNRPYDASKKIILFCPTWRKGNRKKVSDIDLKQLIQKLPDNYEIIVKLHPLEGSMRRYYKELDERIWCFYNELVDIQELYVLADVLISDYSSAIFDYAELSKRIIVMQEDEQSYEKKIGWYFDIQSVCHLTGKPYTVEQLAQEILKPTSPEHLNYSHLIQQRLMTNEHLGATAEALDQILEEGGKA